MLNFLAQHPSKFKTNRGFSLLEAVIALTIFTMLALSVATNIITNQQFIASNTNLFQTETVAYSVTKLISAIPYSDLAVVSGEGRTATLPLPLGNKFFLMAAMASDNTSTRTLIGPKTDFLPRMNSSNLFAPSILTLMGGGHKETLFDTPTERAQPFPDAYLNKKSKVKVFATLSSTTDKTQLFISEKKKRLTGGRAKINPHYYTLFNCDPLTQNYSAHRMDYQCSTYMLCLQPKELVYIEITGFVMDFLASVGGFQGFKDFFGTAQDNNSGMQQRSLAVIVKPSSYEMAYY